MRGLTDAVILAFMATFSYVAGYLTCKERSEKASKKEESQLTES